MDRCVDCDRPEHVCECVDTACQASHVTTFRRDGSRGEIPAVVLGYGTLDVPGLGAVDAGGQNSTFREFDDAAAFAEFLNSDAIFDCVVPSRFLEKR